MSNPKRIPDNSRGRTLLNCTGIVCLVIGTFAALGIGNSSGELATVAGWAVFGWAVTAFVSCLTFGAILGTLVDIRTLLAGKAEPEQQEPRITPAAGT
jgi:hypothetical protein